MPKVSVLLPVYNTKAEYLREAIDSILAQTFTDFELLILDDCSTEPGVAEVVSSYSDGRIKFFRNDRNLGISGSRNKLIELAQGEYLAVTDHDDVSLPQRFELQVEFLDKHPEVGVVGGDLEEYPEYKLQVMPKDHENIENRLMMSSAIMHPASMIRKKVLVDNCIFYEDEFTPAEDYRLWTRLIGKTRFANLPDILIKYREHGQNTSRLQSRKIRSRIYMVQFLARQEHPIIWHRAERLLEVKTKYKLFGVIPFMTMEERYERRKYMLFGCIPLLKGHRQRKLRQ